jgi:hypothetical protein
MTSIRKFAFAALLAASALSFVPAAASAQESAHGKFTLSHEVRWGSATIPAGEYAFSFDPDNASPVLVLSKLSGARAGYMVLVPATEDAKASDVNRLVLETTADGSYVSAMELPRFGMTLHFNAPSHSPEKQIAKAVTTASAGQ